MSGTISDTACTPNTARYGLLPTPAAQHHISASDALTGLSSAPCAPIVHRTPFLDTTTGKKKWPRPVRPSPTSKIATATSGHTSAATSHQVPPGGLDQAACQRPATQRKKNLEPKKTHDPTASRRALATGPITSTQQCRCCRWSSARTGLFCYPTPGPALCRIVPYSSTALFCCLLAQLLCAGQPFPLVPTLPSLLSSASCSSALVLIITAAGVISCVSPSYLVLFYRYCI